MTLESQNRRRIDTVRDPEFVAELATLAPADLRARRALCDELDTELSYYRRLLHGRLDLLRFELRRRRGEETRSLIEALPEILAGPGGGETVTETSPLPGQSRNLSIEPPEIPSTGRREVDRVLEDDFLTHLPTIEDSDLEAILAELVEIEAEVSDQRKDLYGVYERIQEELANRYRNGSADVGEVLGN